MDENLGDPTHSSDVADALNQVLKIQERAMNLFLERRGQREPGSPTRIQQLVLRTVFDDPTITVSDVAEVLHVSNPTASQLVNTMLDKGWIRVALSASDRRRHELALTPQGAEMLVHEREKRLSRVRYVLEHLTPRERSNLVELMDRVLTLWQTTEGSGDDGR